MDDFYNEMSGAVTPQRHNESNVSIRGPHADDQSSVGNQPGTKHTSEKLIKDQKTLKKAPTALDSKLLAYENSIKMNWLRVNMNIFDITKIIMSVYYN